MITIARNATRLVFALLLVFGCARRKHDHTQEEIGLLSFIGEQMGSAVSKSVLAEQNARLREETEEMKRQLETRKLVERAKGILMRRLDLTEEEAFRRMQRRSQNENKKMNEIGNAIITADGML